MGCWNETCFMSNLPIRHGDPVVAFITAQGGWEPTKHRARASFCYPGDEEEPISLPIKARYNDYGSIEDWSVSDVAVLMIEKMFDSPLDEIISRIMDHMRDDYGLSIQRDMTDIGRGVKDYPISMLMMHGGLYDKLIAKYSPMLREENTMDLHAHFETGEKLKALSEKKKKSKLTEVEKVLLESESLHRLTESIAMMGTNRDALRFSGVNLREVLKAVWLDAPKKKRKKLVEEYSTLRTELQALEAAMMYLRRAFKASSGCGSQDFSIKHHLEFADMVKDTIIGTFDNPEDLYNYMLNDY